MVCQSPAADLKLFAAVPFPYVFPRRLFSPFISKKYQQNEKAQLFSNVPSQLRDGYVILSSLGNVQWQGEGQRNLSKQGRTDKSLGRSLGVWAFKVQLPRLDLPQ